MTIQSYPSLSDYSYVAGNPLLFVDLDGKKIIFPNFTSIEQGNLWLSELGLQDEFRINKRGVLKNSLTPFQKNNDLTKVLNKVRRQRDVFEVSYSESNEWFASYYSTPEDIRNIFGVGSRTIGTSLDHQGIPLQVKGRIRRSVTLVIIVNNKNIELEASQFIGAMLGLDGENAARKILGLEEIESSTLNQENYEEWANRKENLEKVDDYSGVQSDVVNAVPTKRTGTNYDGTEYQHYFLNYYLNVWVFPKTPKLLKENKK